MLRGAAPDEPKTPERAETASGEGREQLRMVLAHAPIVLFAFDRNGIFTLSEGRALEPLGLAPGEAVGRTVFELYRDAPEVLERSRAALDGKAFAGVVTLPNGLQFDTWITPVRDAQGNVTGATGVATDVTERGRAQEALRRSEERLRTLVSSAPVILFALDREGVVTLSEGRGLSTLGFRPGELVGRSVFDVYRDRTDLHAICRRALAGEAFTSGDVPVGDVVLETRWTPLRDRDGNLAGTIGVSTDVTERRRADEAIRKAASLESIGLLAAGIAHDFNNILTAIMSNVSLAKCSVADGGETSALLSSVEEASRQARDLTRQLLTFARGGAPVKEAASLAELIRESASFGLRGSSVRFELSAPGDLWAVEVDRTQMSQVIQNLVINAKQAMPGAGTVRAHCENVLAGDGAAGAGRAPLPPGRWVLVSIADEGVGIDDSVMPRIFDPFFTTKPGGFGLGLATAASIVRRHGGQIACESRVGAGTTFTIHLPASTRTPVRTPPANVELEGRGKLLIMDDQLHVRRALSLVLLHLGYDVENARDGAEAIDIYEAARRAGLPFDLVILDLTVVGGMGGAETIARLRELDPAVRALASSGYSDDPVMLDLERHGFSGLVAKPCGLEELGRAVKDALRGNGGA